MKQLVTERLMTFLNTLCMNSIKKTGSEVHFVEKCNIQQIKSHTTQGINKNSPGHRVMTIRISDLSVTLRELLLVHILTGFQVATLNLMKKRHDMLITELSCKMPPSILHTFVRES